MLVNPENNFENGEIDEEESLRLKRMHFSDEEIERIDRFLAEGEEYQRQHGNQTYSIEELWGAVLEEHYKYI